MIARAIIKGIGALFAALLDELDPAEHDDAHEQAIAELERQRKMRAARAVADVAEDAKFPRGTP